MSKMISQYLILEAIKNGEVTWGTQIPVSDRVHQLSANYSLSNVPLLPSENTRLKNYSTRFPSIQPTPQH